MQISRMTFVLAACLGGCSWLTDSREFSVYFQPYSSEIDQQAAETIRDAGKFAQAHPLLLVAVEGFSAPTEPKRDLDGLSAQRAERVKQALLVDGVSPQRITTSANGIVDPKTLPSVSVRRVDISVTQ
jgi:outer membrane protein OmpA-like peptidoglycan-associated protein